MKKTITALAILASGSMAFAIARPIDPNAPQPKLRNICLKVAQITNDGSLNLSTCDSTPNNTRAQVQLLENGCAEGQASLKTYNKVAINACMPPGMVQL